MGTTPVHDLPYPEGTDYLAQGATIIEALAEALDAKIGQQGRVTWSSPAGIPAVPIVTYGVTFPKPFPSSGPVPVVTISHQGSASTLRWFARAYDVTRTGFTINVNPEDPGNLLDDLTFGFAWHAAIPS